MNLTPREREVANLLVSTDLMLKQIAAKLDIKHSTLKNHVLSIYKKAGVSSRLGLALFIGLLADNASYPAQILPGGPVFNSPSVAGITKGCSSVNTVIDEGQNYYHIHRFMVTQSGIYTMTTVSAGFDSVLLLYSIGFDPSRPMENLMAAADDRDIHDSRATITCNLKAGVHYTLVTTTYDFMTSGSFVNDITGPGVIY